MAISFPSSPTLNQTYSYGGKTWTWSGSVWNLNTMVAMDMSDTAPASPSIGALWMNTLTGDLLVYHSSGWMQSGGDVGGVGPTGPTGPSGTNGTNGVDVTTPKITGIVICDSNYSFIDDTAVSTAGGYILVNGTNFTSGSTAVINNTPATSVSFINSTQLRVQIPATPAGTYILYVVGLDGSVAIRVNAVTSSAVPIWTTGSTLPNAVKNGNINIQLATDVGLTYALSGVSTLPPGLSLNSGGLLSGSVTGLSVETTYSFIVIATDLELQDTPRTFSITITVGDPYFNLTTLLLQADTGPTYISDASSNTFEINPVGSVKSDTSQPFQEGYYSGFFNGSTDYLTLTNNTALGSGSFTIECWVYPTATPATNAWIYGYRNGGDTSPQLWINSSRQPVFGADISTYITSSTALSLSTWSHIAIVRNGTAMVMYINGVSINTATTSQNFSYTGANSIGAANGASIYAWAGYISNLRVVSGVAVYTAAFSPPTAPLTITQSTETLAAPTAVDYLVVAGGGGGGQWNSGGGGAGGYRTATGFSITSGTPYTVTVGLGGIGGSGGTSPIGIAGSSGDNSVFGSITSIGGGGGGSHSTAVAGAGGSGGGAGAWAGTATGGAASPSGQGNAGGSSSNGASTPPYAGAGGGGAGAVGQSANPGAGGIGLSSSISGSAVMYAGGGGAGGNTAFGAGGTGGGGAGTTTTGVAGTVNTGGGGGGGGATGSGVGGAGGSGIVIIRHTNTLAVATCTGSPTITVSDNYRIYKFTSSGTITFNTETRVAITGTDTSLLTLQSNRFKDQTAANLAITTAGTPAIKTLQPFTLPTTWATYGAGYFGIKTDYLTVPATTSLTTFTGDFTFEAWVYPTDTSITQLGIWDSRQSAATATALVISLSALATPIAGSYRLLYYNGAYNYGTGTGQYNQWAHIAIVRSGSTMTFYINGVAGGTSTISGTQTATATSNPIYIGNKDNGLASYGSVGYISNLRLVNGTAVYTGNFTPPTSLLTTTQASGANIAAITTGQTSLLTLQYKQGSNNNGFIDSSQNNFPITRVGTPTQGTSSPFSQTGWSGNLGGGSNYLTVANNAILALGSGDFTVELWVYPNSLTGTQALVGTGNGASVEPYCYLNLTIPTFLYNSVNVATGPAVVANTWTHVAFVRSGSTITVYTNGAAGTAASPYTTTFTTSGIYIGTSSAATQILSGYLSNIRIVKGTAVYTANFTPPTAPLTAITNTTLLTLQNNRFKDNSTNTFTITPTGTPSIQAFSPFAAASAYTTSAVGGTGYFNGTTDGLSVLGNAAFNFTGDYTAEAWVNWSSVAVESDVIGNFVSSVASDWMIVKASASTLQYYPSSAATFVNSGITPTINTWYHIAAVRSGTTCSLYVNGVSVGTPLTFSGTLGDATKVVRVGSRSATNYIPGYLSNVRIVKGTAVYTGTFTPPTAPLTASGATSAASYPSTTNVNITFPAANTSLLLNGTNGGIIDATSKNSITTVGDARISTAQKKFGTGSMYFDGTGDYLSIPSSINNTFGTGNFTVECWSYYNNFTNSSFILDQRPSGVNGVYVSIFLASGIPYYYVSTANQITGNALSINTWYHIAISRSGSSTKMFIDGVQVGSTYTDTNNYLGGPILIGGSSYAIGTAINNGYIDDFRITKYARYTANFTPPVGGFPAQ